MTNVKRMFTGMNHLEIKQKTELNETLKKQKDITDRKKAELNTQFNYAACCYCLSEAASHKRRSEHIKHKLPPSTKLEQILLQPRKKVLDLPSCRLELELDCWLTLFKWCLEDAPKISTRSNARNNPMAVMISVFRTGISATTNKSQNAIKISLINPRVHTLLL